MSKSQSSMFYNDFEKSLRLPVDSLFLLNSYIERYEKLIGGV